MKKKTSTNSFEKGLVMDFNPLVVPEKTYCNALNATLITHNGNENVLQNDMGNGRVETAYLPEGYVPLGTAELGGIIYIVSYNPLINKCQIGSFPSPERNITSDESEGPEAHTFNTDGFYNKTEEEQDSSGNNIYHINKTSIKLDINIIQDGEELIFNPGDKYMLFFDGFDSKEEKYNYLSAYNEISTLQYQYLPRYLSFQVLAVSENGLQFNMTEDNVWLPIKGLERDRKQSYYYINTSIEENEDGNYDLDEYRNLVSSNYNVFSSKQSGTLQVALNLECINSFDVSWDAYKLESDEWAFYFYLNWTYDNDKSPDKINLHGIFCKYYLNNSISNQTPDYKKSELIEINGEKVGYPILINDEMRLGTTDIMLYQENIINGDDYNVTFCTPYYIDALDDFIDQINNNEEGTINPYINGVIINNGISNFRKNDDSDFQYLLGKPFLVNENAKTDTGEDNIITMEVYPTMPYGVIDYLGTKFNINLAKLGTGQIILTTYKYYIQDSDIIFNYGFDAYPERNKKVKDVTFNFYEIDDPNTANSVGEWIYNNSKCIDEYMLMHYTNVAGSDVCVWYDPVEWKETNYSITNILSECNEDITPEDFSFIDDKESSYSGTFTKTISKNEIGLDNIGKTYIVEINVNYNNEKHICYYRIFYTQPIFNNNYYNDDYLDFKDIELDNCLNISYDGNLISSEISNIDDTLNIITDLGEEKIDNIPSYKLESTENIKYCINNTHQVNTAQLELNATDNYNLFNVEIELDEKSEIGIEINPENDAIADNYGTNIINFDNITYDIIEEEGNFPIAYIDKDAKNTIILRYKIITHIPIFINYTNYKNANVNYQFSHLSYDAYFIFGYGQRKWFHIYTSRYLYLDRDKESNCVKVSDDIGKEYMLEAATQIYDVLYDSLINNNNDVVLLACGSSGNTDKSFSPGISCGNSYIGNGYKHSNGDWKTYKSAKSLWDNILLTYPNYYMLLNAFKGKNDEIMFITYSDSDNAYANTNLTIETPKDPLSSYTDKGYDGSNGGGTFIKTTHGNEIVDSGGYINGELLFKPLENLYKLVETANTIEIYEYNELYFYDTFFNDVNININCNYVTKLYINKNILINNFNNIKNFNYNNNNKNTFNFVDSYKINSRQYIDNITKCSDLIFVLDVDGNLVTNNIYVSWEENKLYTFRNNEYISTSSLPYSNYNQKQSLEHNNQKVTIKITNTTYPTDLGIAFYFEELGIALRGVTII